jgi:pimeloyl-ACP methyl ester carboxylesterase
MARRFRPQLVLLLAVYLLALAWSLRTPGRPAVVSETGPLVPPMTAEGIAAGEPVRVRVLAWGDERDPRPPVLLLHGSPGTGRNMERLGIELARDGRRSIAIDLPGFGLSTREIPDYSIRAHARYALAALDELGVGRAHVVGWSMGGGVGLNMGDLAPDRVASLTMLASIGAQDTEGSGSHAFEKAKYALGYAVLVWGPGLVPHFGLYDSGKARAFVRNFLDSDQRPLRRVMESMAIPVLILHGRRDPLIADRAAERHHAIIPTSRLVMTPDSHFLPMLQAEQTAGWIGAFIARHDAPGVEAETGVIDLAPRGARTGFAGAFDGMLGLVRATPWWGMALVCAGLARLRRETATALAGVFVGQGVLDFGVALVGLMAGRALHPREPWLRRDLAWVAGLPVWSGVSLLVAQLASGHGSPVDRMGPAGFVAWIAVVAVGLNLLKLLPTRTGRRRIVACVRRCARLEWWPSWAVYGVLVPGFVRMAFWHRSLTCWTCVNPGIRPGGGIVGESKQAILEGFNDPCVLAQRRVEGATASARPERARTLVERDPALGGFPVIVKPDAGQRGAGVSLARDGAGLALALGAVRGAVNLQRYHPGPVECGVFWVRDAGTVGAESADATQGRIFAVTRKIFPVLEGDGVCTVRRLILDHPRFNLQAGVYCENLRGRLGEIPAEGARITLTATGNHARGCRFEDGADLITPELSERIDRIARTWRGPGGEAFDFGRFDVRCPSEDDLRAGRGLAVIELNGVTSEATNLYDPSWSARRSLGVLAEQWAIAFELGAARMRRGARPLGLFGLLAVLLGRGGRGSFTAPGEGAGGVEAGGGGEGALVGRAE